MKVPHPAPTRLGPLPRRPRASPAAVRVIAHVGVLVGLPVATTLVGIHVVTRFGHVVGLGGVVIVWLAVVAAVSATPAAAGRADAVAERWGSDR